MRDEFHLPIVFAGFSFGSATGMRAACPDPEVEALISLGTPINAEGRLYTYALLEECTKPKLFVSGDHDEFAPVAMLAKVVDLAAEPKRFVLVKDADHFFAGHLDEMRAAIVLWIGETLGVSR
jgi:alpha/beta superfamily hydrolase